MFKKLSVKLAIQIVVILIVITALCAPLYIRTQREAYTSSRMEDMNTFYGKLSQLSFVEEKKAVKALMQDESAAGYTVKVYNEEFQQLYRAKNRKNKTVKQPKKERRFRRYKANAEAMLIEQKNGKKVILLRGIVTQDGQQYYVLIKEVLTSMDSILAYTNRNMVFILIGYMLVCSAAIIILINVVIKRIKSLSAVAEKIAQKDYSVRYNGKIKKDEVGVLSEKINQMADTIQENITALDNYNFLLKEDLNYLTEYEDTRKKVLSNVTHELKTPLAIISSQVEMIRYTEDEAKKMHYYDSVMEEVEKMSNMITSLLNYSVTGRDLYQGEAVELDLSAAVDELCEKCKNHIESKKLRLRTEIEPECTLYIEKNHIDHVFNNYLSNAIYHTKPAGEILVRLRKREQKVRLSIFNPGLQIAEEYKTKIWTEFFSYRERQEDKEKIHAGLGLFIVKEIATIEHTECGFENQANGVEFWFDFNGKEA